MYLIFDTETSSFTNKNLPAKDPRQAHLLQLGAVLLDARGETLDEYGATVQLPPDVQIAPGAAEAHGVTIEQVRAGVTPQAAYDAFVALTQRASRLMAYNMPFDWQVLVLFSLQNGFGLLPFQKIMGLNNCIMRVMTPIVNIPNKNGTLKFPKLKESYKFCFGREFANAHNALADARATAEVWRWWLHREAPPAAPPAPAHPLLECFRARAQPAAQPQPA